MTPTQDQIEAAFNFWLTTEYGSVIIDGESKRIRDERHAWESCAKWLLAEMEKVIEAKQREAWFAAVTPTCDCGEADCPWEEWDRNKYDNWQKMQKAGLRTEKTAQGYYVNAHKNRP